MNRFLRGATRARALATAQLIAAAALFIAFAPERSTSLDYVERVTGNGDPAAKLPMVVAIHGLGDRPESFAALFEGFPAPVRVILPRAPLPWSGGFAWFPYRMKDRDEGELSRGIDGAADSVARLIRTLARPTMGKPIVTGFSQGGMISFGIAARHPEVVSLALPIGGLLPTPSFPAAGARTVPIRAFHGEADPRVPLEQARRTIQAFRNAGYSAVLLEYPATGHTISADMHVDWARALLAATSTSVR
ncbi:MAG: dienelactone hydrolase family protein [Deltaproteobacteria bacterium]|nr:dienelactone hydrolase family protein [Deltaproteobacteria bacterium]